MYVALCLQCLKHCLLVRPRLHLKAGELNAVGWGSAKTFALEGFEKPVVVSLRLVGCVVLVVPIRLKDCLELAQDLRRGGSRCADVPLHAIDERRVGQV